MRKWKVLVAVLTVACVAPTAFAQQEQILDELQALKSRVLTLEQENTELKGTVVTQNDADLELQINALTDRLAAGTTVNSAANPVTLSGEFRFRNAWSFGDDAAGSEHDGSWTDSVVRLGFQYDFTRDVTAYAELQSNWAFGEGSSPDAGPLGTTTGVTMHQAWVEMRNLFGRSEFSTRTGRQEMTFGNQFQFGNADWYNGWAFDGTRWDWNSESFSLTGFFLKLDYSNGIGDINQTTSFDTDHDDDEMLGLYFTLKTIENTEVDVYWMYNNGHGEDTFVTGSGVGANGFGNFEPSGGGDTNYFHTIGARVGGMFGDIASGLDWNVEFAYQFGDSKVDGGGDTDVEGFALEAELGVTFNADSNFRVYSRLLWAEGADSDDTGYIALFPNRHSNGGFRARYGSADVMPMENVLSLQGGFHFDPTDAWTLGATVVWGEEENSDSDYGVEIDIWAEYRYSEHLTFNTGVAMVFPDDAGEAAFGFNNGVDDDMQFMLWVQARLLF